MKKRSRRLKRVNRQKIYFLPILLFAVGVFYGGYYIGYTDAQLTVGHTADQITGSFRNRLTVDLTGRTSSAGVDGLHIIGGDPTMNHVAITTNKRTLAIWSAAKSGWADFTIGGITSTGIWFPQDGGTDSPRITTEVPGTALDIVGAGTFPDRKITIHDDLNIRSQLTVAGTPVCLQTGANCPSGGNIGGSGAAGWISRFYGGQSIGNSVIFQSGNRIGIGTTSPGHSLHVVGSTHIAQARFDSLTSTFGRIQTGGDIVGRTISGSNLQGALRTRPSSAGGFGTRISCSRGFLTDVDVDFRNQRVSGNCREPY